MYYCELQEMRRVLMAHEESIQGNETPTIIVVDKLHEIDNEITTQNATIMGTLVWLKHQIFVLEIECNKLKNIVINLTQGEHSIAPNNEKPINSNCEG